MFRRSLTPIVNLTTQSVLSDTKDLNRVVKKLEQQRMELEAQIGELTDQILDQEKRSDWVDWIGKYRKQMTDLDSLSPEDKQQFLSGLVSEIIVNEADKQRHKLEIHFKFPYVGDKLIWDDKGSTRSKKKKTYTLVEGKRIKTKTVNLLKKS